APPCTRPLSLHDALPILIATGHYARVREIQVDGRPQYQLLKGLDATKDQSYFLHRLNQAQLARTRFPLGELPKTEVRRIAAELRSEEHTSELQSRENLVC